uniref:EF-hand domain-containing protein n=1 Tax=Octactis speculum TaxID=3111310 RepID=A0A7S2GUE3_9STRA|mmetsp:Transcript_57186/g.77990  ORF Transcript_57186/g.77990 Transcript_57186/m.77990 type:complete len:333 (+) Transcript_57186:20-1018(+)
MALDSHLTNLNPNPLITTCVKRAHAREPARATSESPMLAMQRALIKERIKARTRASSKVLSLVKEKKDPMRDEEGENLTSKDPQARAMAKLRRAAKIFDLKRHGARQQLDGFSGRRLSPNQLKDGLRRAFLLRLDDDEIQAIMFKFDSNGDGYMDTDEFARFFLQISLSAAAQPREAQANEDSEREIMSRREASAKNLEERNREKSLLDLAFRDEDRAAYQDKLEKASKWWHRKHYHDQIQLDTFARKFSPTELQVALQNVLGVRLKDRELAALCSDMSRHRSGLLLDGANFRSIFLRLHKDHQDTEAANLDISNLRRKAKAPQFPGHVGIL